MSRPARMAAFDLGLALVSFVVIMGVSWDVTGGQRVNWPLAGVNATAILIGAHVTSRVEPAKERAVRRFIRRTLLPLLIGFPVGALVSALIAAVFVQGGIAGFFWTFVLMLMSGAATIGLPLLVATTLWALVYVGLERRIAGC